MEYTHPEIAADVYRIIRANTHRTKEQILALLRKEHPGNWDKVVVSLGELGLGE